MFFAAFEFNTFLAFLVCWCFLVFAVCLVLVRISIYLFKGSGMLLVFLVLLFLVLAVFSLAPGTFKVDVVAEVYAHLWQARAFPAPARPHQRSALQRRAGHADRRRLRPGL